MRRALALLVLALLATAGTAHAVVLGPDPAPAPPGTPRFDFILSGHLGTDRRAPDQPLWTAEYHRTLTSDAEWLEGGRQGYRCGWAFLTNEEGDIIARVAFLGGYGAGAISKVNDQNLDDHDSRYWSGAPYVARPNESRDCPFLPALGDYSGPAEFPVLRVYEEADLHVLEVRSYLDEVYGPGVTARLHSNITTQFTSQGNYSAPHTVYQRVVVQALLAGQEIINVYYDILDPGYSIDVTP